MCGEGRGLGLKIMTIVTIIMATIDRVPLCGRPGPSQSCTVGRSEAAERLIEHRLSRQKLGFKFASASYHLCDLGQDIEALRALISSSAKLE